MAMAYGNFSSRNPEKVHPEFRIADTRLRGARTRGQQGSCFNVKQVLSNTCFTPIKPLLRILLLMCYVTMAYQDLRDRSIGP